VRRTIDWGGDAVTIIDQTTLPGDYRVLTLRTVDEVITNGAPGRPLPGE